MFKIVQACDIHPNVRKFVIEAPNIARQQKPGQFVSVRLHELGERTSIAIHSSDPAAGTITLVVQAINKTTALLNCLDAGYLIPDVAGPVDGPAEIKTTAPA